MQTKEVVEWLDSAGIELANTPDATTYLAHHGQHTSVLDLVGFNAPASAIDLVKDYHLDTNILASSDHTTSRWTVDFGKERIDNPTTERYK